MFFTFALSVQSLSPIPPVNLNHFFITVDRKTFDAIHRSKWLKETFAEVVMGTNTSGDRTWTGLYLYGVGSYIEIFAADEKRKEGSAGVGFLTATTGGADIVFDQFRRSPFGTRAERELMMMGTKTLQEPYAHTVSYSGQEKTNLNLWLMEYHSEYYKSEGAPVGASEAEIFAADRSKHKAPYGGMMADLRSLTLRPFGDGKDIKLALGLFGYQQVKGQKIWRREMNELRVLPTLSSKSRYGISSVRFSLRTKPSRTHIEHFGPKCQLRVSRYGTAEWRFR